MYEKPYDVRLSTFRTLLFLKLFMFTNAIVFFPILGLFPHTIFIIISANAFISFLISFFVFLINFKKIEKIFNRRECMVLIKRIQSELIYLEKFVIRDTIDEKKYFNKVSANIYLQIEQIKKEMDCNRNYEYLKFWLDEIWRNIKTNYSNFPTKKKRLVLEADEIEKLEEKLDIIGIEKETRNFGFITEKYRVALEQSVTLQDAVRIKTAYMELRTIFEDSVFCGNIG